MISQFEDSGTIVNASNSVVLADNCGIINQSASYAAVVSSNLSKIRVRNSRISAIAETAVVFSSHDGEVELDSNSCKVIGSIGRIAEFIGTKCRLTSNSFIGEVDTSRNSTAIWKDGDVKIFVDKNNVTKGF